MKKNVLILVTFLIILLSCSSDDKTEKNNNIKKGALELQREMLFILEKNVDNPQNALKELDEYYKKYSSVLKKQLINAKENQSSVSDEYKASMSGKEKKLYARQQIAIKKILKLEPNFNMKFMLILKKYGLSSNN